jgi:predicted dehydrogenase
MSKTWEESRRIVQAVQEAGTRLMVGYNRRFSPALAAAKAAFQSRNRGKKAMLTYRAVDDATFWPRWPFDVKVGGGKVLSEACHFFDLLCWFLEDEPVAVQCAGGREDNNLIEVAFRNGSIACVISGGCGHDGFGKERLEVFCDGSTLMMDQFLELQLNGYDGWGDANFDMADDPYPDAGPGNTVAGYRERMLRWLKRGPTEEESRTKAYYSSMPRVNKGHFEELEAYARSIRSGGPSPCDEVDGARATAMSLKAIQSLEDGQRPQPISGEDYFLDLKRK